MVISELRITEGVTGYYGNVRLLEREVTVVLNSRQSKTPVGNDEWVVKTIEACRMEISEGRTLIASVGMNTWELVLWAVGKYQGRAIVLIPEDREEKTKWVIDRIATDFGLDLDRHLWLTIPSGTDKRSSKSWWAARDEASLKLAGRIVPVSIRRNGGFGRCLNEYGSAKVVDYNFGVKYQEGIAEKKIKVPDRCREFGEWDHITHWTSRSNGPWPGEGAVSYYEDIVASSNLYARSAFFTLKRILSEEKLRGSGRHMKANEQAVGFTSLKPEKAVELMRWRARYVRPTFEPYGVAIRVEAAERLGIMPVKYVKTGTGETRNGEESDPLRQGYGVGDWPKEQEWRGIGDVDLRDLASGEVTVLVPSEEEAEAVREETRFGVISIGKKQ
jgi:hypothetical protein